MTHAPKIDPPCQSTLSESHISYRIVFLFISVHWSFYITCKCYVFPWHHSLTVNLQSTTVSFIAICTGESWISCLYLFDCYPQGLLVMAWPRSASFGFLSMPLSCQYHCQTITSHSSPSFTFCFFPPLLFILLLHQIFQCLALCPHSPYFFMSSWSTDSV